MSSLDFFRKTNTAIKALETPLKAHELDGKKHLKYQLLILKARHLFVAEGKGARDIADQLGIRRSQVADWVSRYGWRSMRTRRALMRELGIMVKYDLNVKALKEQHSTTLSFIYDALEDILSQVREGELSLSPQELKIALDTAVKCHEEYVAIHGEPEKKLSNRIEFTETFKRMVAVKEQPKELEAPRENLIQIEDAEFDNVR